MRPTRVVTLALLLTGGVLAVPAFAEKDLLKIAKEAGYPATSCQYCHTTKLPKKDTFKPEELNERGKWLAAEKTKQKAKIVSVDWLKGYPGSKEQ
ncbi:MAG TPA: hypothetical protein VNW71_06415 [Thermoanaerobaculia bacterium]|nr:hypothetical protein [Thermoanaerobaculia bacterium]